MKNILKPIIAAALIFGLSSCEKKADTPIETTETYGDVNIDFNYVWGMGMEDFTLNDTLIHPMNGDTLVYSTFKHYISNIKLTKDDGTMWTQSESYHFLDVSDPNSLSINISDVPTGNYTGMEVTFGVDSNRNVSGAQSGALDVINGMFWNWNSGYIMLKAEGSSPQSTDGSFAYHIGGFSGENNVVSAKDFTFSSDLVISETEIHKINFRANPAKLFHTYGSVENGSFHMPGPNAKMMADDFNGWTNISSIE
ncbi:hypothetical protein OAT71_02335 [Flavobacteriales bacterium]|nr:hypothetical protein [Flavobacteriales bacterium]